MALFQINRSEWISLDQQYRIQYFTYRGGKSEWVISRKNGKYFSAMTSAKDLESAKNMYRELVGA
jgi:TnpA family transposase